MKRRSGGFSLVELMVALLLGLFVIAGAEVIYLSSKQEYRTNRALGQVQDSTRIVFEMMSREIRQAGMTGCGNAGRVANVLRSGPNGALTKQWYADFANALYGYDGGSTDPAVAIGTATTNRVAGTDSIMLISSFDTASSIASHTAHDGVITIAEANPNLQRGDIVVLCDPDHAAIAQISTYSNSPATITLSAGGSLQPGNCSIGLGYFTDCSSSSGNQYPFVVNSLVAKLSASDWYIGINPQGGRSLYRATLTNVAGDATVTLQEMVRDVQDMQLTYHLPGAATYVSAGSVGSTAWPTVDAVALDLLIRGSEPTAGTNAQPVARRLKFDVSLRNRN